MPDDLQVLLDWYMPWALKRQASATLNPVDQQLQDRRVALPPWVTEERPVQSAQEFAPTSGELGREAIGGLASAVTPGLVGGGLGYALTGGSPVGALAGAVLPYLAQAHPEIERALTALGPWMPGPETGLALSALPFLAKPVLTAPNLDRIINARQSFYHATGMKGFEKILESGVIFPGGVSPYTGIIEAQGGVSVSRVPRIASKAGKSISFVLDPDKMPPTQAYAERNYGKTIEKDIKWTPDLGDPVEPINSPGTPNTQFEFEQRTRSRQPVSLKAVKGIVVDRIALANEVRPDFGNFDYDHIIEWAKQRKDPALGTYEAFKNGTTEYARVMQDRAYRSMEANYLDKLRSSATEDALRDIRALAAKQNIPVKVYPSGRTTHSYRAGLSRETGPLFGAASTALGLEALTRQYLKERSKE